MTDDSIRKPLILWAARIGPYNSPYNGHACFDLPFCHHYLDSNDPSLSRPNEYQYSLGELLGGIEWQPFAQLPPLPNDARGTFVQDCNTTALTQAEADKLAKAVEDRWFYQMFVGDLPLWGMVGETTGTRDRKVYTERTLAVALNQTGDIVRVEMISNPRSLQPIQVGQIYNYKFRVEFERDRRYDVDKFDRYLDHGFFNGNARATYSVNAGMQAFFMMVLAYAVVKAISKHNNAKETATDAEKGEATTTSSARPTLDPKNVFLPPKHTELLAALIGNGWHLLVWLVVMIVLFMARNPLEYGPGGRWGVVLYTYGATSIVAGYGSASYFQLQEQRGLQDGSWKRAAVLTALLVPTVASILLIILQLAAREVETIDRISSKGMLTLLLLWVGGVVPSHFIGTVLGRWHQNRCPNSMEQFLAFSIMPTTGTPKQSKHKIAKKLLTNRAVVALLAAIIMFSATIIESYYFLASIWNYKYYLVSWVNLVTLLALIIITGLSGTAAALLSVINEQDSKLSWQWNAFATSATVGPFWFLYAMYYYFYKTNLQGMYTAFHYFTTMIGLSLIGSVICGAVGHAAAYRSMQWLHSNIKKA